MLRFHEVLCLSLVALGSSCKSATESYSSVMVVNGTVITSADQAKKNAKGAYGVQMVYQNAEGDIKQQEATGFFTDPKGTTFITNGHVDSLTPPSGYTLKERRIVDYAGNTVQTVPNNVDSFVNPGAATRPDRDLAMWKFPEGIPPEKLTHGTAQFAAPGYDLSEQRLSVAGYGTNTNSPTETAEYQKMRYGPIGTVDNPTGNTFGYYGPRLDSDPGRTVSSAPGDSGAPIYGSSGAIVGINRGGKNIDADSSYSEAINPYGPGAQSFFTEVQKRGGVVQGYGQQPAAESPSQAPESPSAGTGFEGESDPQPSQFSGNPATSDVMLP